MHDIMGSRNMLKNGELTLQLDFLTELKKDLLKFNPELKFVL